MICIDGKLRILYFQLQAAGFDYNMAKLALKKHNGDIMQAADELIKNDGIVVNADGLLSLEGKMSMNLIK